MAAHEAAVLCLIRGAPGSARRSEASDNMAPSPMVLRHTLLALTLLLAGCGNAIYAVHITRASNELARAEQLGAARRAPYEYQFALEHFEKARSEALEADYGDAISLADVAHEYARRAVQLAQRVERVSPAGVSRAP
jgi:hypothetical protein